MQRFQVGGNGGEVLGLQTWVVAVGWTFNERGILCCIEPVKVTGQMAERTQSQTLETTQEKINALCTCQGESQR